MDSRSRSHPCTRHQVTGDKTGVPGPPHPRATQPPSTSPGLGQGALANKCFWEYSQWGWTGPTHVALPGPPVPHIRAGDPTVAPLPTNTLTLLPAPVVPRNALGIQRATPTIWPATCRPGRLGGPPLLARMNALWTCRRITWEEMGGTETPCFLLLFLSSVLCLFLSLWRLPACGWLRRWA